MIGENSKHYKIISLHLLQTTETRSRIYLHYEVDDSQRHYNDHKDGYIVDNHEDGTDNRDHGVKHVPQLVR